MTDPGQSDTPQFGAGLMGPPLGPQPDSRELLIEHAVLATASAEADISKAYRLTTILRDRHAADDGKVETPFFEPLAVASGELFEIGAELDELAGKLGELRGVG